MSTYEQTAQLLKVLGHPLRLKIAIGLVKQPKCVRDIWGCLGLPQAVISQHLALLKKNGVIAGQRHGVEMHYTVTDPLAKAIIEYIDSAAVTVIKYIQALPGALSADKIER